MNELGEQYAGYYSRSSHGREMEITNLVEDTNLWMKSH